MAVFRVEKTGNFTVMANHHLRDKNLSLKRGRHSHGAQGIDPGGVCRLLPQTERYGAAEGS